jgi:hypothetical protein
MMSFFTGGGLSAEAGDFTSLIAYIFMEPRDISAAKQRRVVLARTRRKD